MVGISTCSVSRILYRLFLLLSSVLILHAQCAFTLLYKESSLPTDMNSVAFASIVRKNKPICNMSYMRKKKAFFYKEKFIDQISHSPGPAPVALIVRGSASNSASEKETKESKNVSFRIGSSTAYDIGPPSVLTGTYTSITQEIHLSTLEGISIHDLTPSLEEIVAKSNIQSGCLTVLSKHTTTSIFINEFESRLQDDIRQYLGKLAPAMDPYLHNDLHLRPATYEDKTRIELDTTVQEWRANEPKNAHSHLLSMLVGSSESIPIVDGKLGIGRWQSIMMIELDGPRKRSVGINLQGVV